MYWLRWLSVAIFATVLQSAIATDYPFVTLSRKGKVRGIYMSGSRINRFNVFEAFMGIPYAKPPVGARRFANPVFADPIVGTLNATAPRADCIQKNYLLSPPLLSGEEDCLYLNVYRPIGASPTKSLPVMVYIYGGGFFSGTAHPSITGPEYFMDTQKVILVTMAYRLGALGFLSTGDSNSPGNYALKDQAMALRWVRQYISKFGGKIESITLFGQSAGAASVHMHMLNQQSPTLFQRAIIMSGSAAAPFNDYLRDPLAQARQQAKFVGIPNYNNISTKKLIDELRQVDAAELVSSGDQFKYWHVDPLTTFRPVVERNVSGAFLTRDPRDVIRDGAYYPIPFMMTFVPYEGAVRTLSILSNQTLVNEFNDNFDELLIQLLEIPYNSEKDRDWYVQQFVDNYMHGIHKLTLETAEGFGNMISGRGFNQALNFTIENYRKYGDIQKNPLYLTQFNYRGTLSYSYLFAGNTKDYGVVHCDDLIYLFNSSAIGFTLGEGSVDSKVSAALIENFVTFTIDGHPKKHTYLEPCHQMKCEYQEFRNSDKSPGFEVITSSEFNVTEMEFLNRLLPY